MKLINNLKSFNRKNKEEKNLQLNKKNYNSKRNLEFMDLLIKLLLVM